MKNKKIIIVFSLLVIIVCLGGFFTIKYLKNNKQETSVEEYIPEEEITDEQFRQTIVSLYFLNSESQKLMPEARLVDIREVINNPYEKLMNLLIEGPKNEKLKKLIPDNTKVLKTYIDGDCVIVDLSKELLDYNKEDENEKYNLINSVVNTLTELTEVNKVKILIEGSANSEFSEIYVRINNI